MVRLAATLAMQTRLRLTMPSSPPAEIRLPSPSPEFLDRYSAESRLIASSLQEALCVSEAFTGTRCSAYYFYGRLEACRGLSGDDLLQVGRAALPKRLQQPLTIHVEGTLSGDDHFIADTLVGADGDRFLALDRLAFLGFDVATAVCCSSFPEVDWCHRRWKAGCFGRSELPTDGIIVRLASSSSLDSYAFAMN
uniref:Uncharacterized protein n=1 Tax=Synechococcus phage S-CAM8 TaxID=754038 RepID=G8EY44_9CAUD